MAPLQRLLSPIVELRKEESVTALLMFAYSFLALAAHNTIKPLTRSKFIADLGVDNLPYVMLAAGLIIGIVMAGYVWVIARLPRRWALPITQAALAAVVLLFWFLFRTGAVWVSVAFFVFSLMLAVLLVSQFWTVANLVYDPRQAKRLFGFIYGGAPLGGVAGSALASYAKQIGSVNLILPSAAAMAACALIAAFIIRREGLQGVDAGAGARQEKGVSAIEAIDLLRRSKHLQIIALVIALPAIGAVIIEQQLNTAAAASKGAGATDAITAFLAQVQLWTSAISFVIQVWLTSRIHRYLGVGFALMVLPVSLGSTAVVMLLNGALWAPALARVLDQSLRYSVDKTTREILFLPLPADIKLKAKSFVDVTVDRGAKALGALLLVVLVKPWGLHLSWQQLSYASLSVTVLWIFMALRARRGYLHAFRQSIEQRDFAPAEVRLNAADLSTVETLVQELAHPDPARVVYAIDVIESLDKRNLVTPLLLYHESPTVRRRALGALGAVRGDIAQQWTPQIKRLLSDPDAGVRAAAIGALGTISNDDVATLARPLLSDLDPRIRVTAAVALASSQRGTDIDAAEAALLEIASDTDEGARHARRDVAAAIRQIPDARFRRMLIPLLYDAAPEVANEAMESVRAAGTDDFIFVPTLVGLLRQRQLKGEARRVLVSYGEPVVDALAHFMRDPDEDVWVRRHIPATLARIQCQKSVDVLVGALGEQDGFLRFKAVTALERLRRERPDLAFPRDPIEALALKESGSYFNALSLRANLYGRTPQLPDSLLSHALDEKLDRTKDRLYRLLSLVYPWKDIAAARWTLEHGDPRSRASASEYLDNVLGGQLRKRVMPILEDLPPEERVRRGNVLLKTRPRDVEETLLQLINDDDQVIAASAIDAVRQQKMWTLGDDVEHVLAYRDVRDWYVFEAASWALAERRMTPERRRELWLEPLPAAELAGRLRQLPLFASVSVDELFRMGSAARQVRHDPGSVLQTGGAVPDVVHLLLDGRVTAVHDGDTRTIEPSAALGFDEALQGQPMRETVRTVDIAVTLALTGEELRTLLSDNTDLVSGLFATIVQRAGDDHPVIRCTAGSVELEELVQGGLTPVEKVFALRRVPLFARLSPEEIGELSSVARIVPIVAGEKLFDESSAPGLWLVLSGDLTLESSAGAAPARAAAGDVVGAAHAMAGRPLGRTAHATRDGVAVRIDRDELFDLLSDRPEMLRQMFAALFRTAGQQVVA